MEGLLYSLLSNRQATFVNMVIGALLFIVLLFCSFARAAAMNGAGKSSGKQALWP